MIWTKVWVYLGVLALFSGMGLLVYGGVTFTSWACNIGLPLLLIGIIPVAYQLAKSDPR